VRFNPNTLLQHSRHPHNHCSCTNICTLQLPHPCAGVRITHTPTGLSVKCTQERTQQANRAIAMDMLKAKLLVVLEEQKAQRVGWPRA